MHKAVKALMIAAAGALFVLGAGCESGQETSPEANPGALNADHPQGEHPEGEHPQGEHPEGEHPEGEHPDQ